MQTRPLEGVRVIDLTTYGAGPATGRVLADWGADVIKVENLTGDIARYSDSNYGIPCDMGAGPSWEIYNANKRGISVDLKSDEGKTIMEKLLAGANVFLSNNRLRALKRMNLDYESMSARHPHIIWAHLSGYGTEGPNGDDPGFDTIAFWARAGKLIDFAEKDTAPLVPPISVGDSSAGPMLAGGIAAALYRQQKTGKGDKVMISLYGMSVWSLATMNLGTQCTDNLFPKSRKDTAPLTNTYRCKDGEWIVLTMFEWERYFPVICRLLGMEDAANDFRFANIKVAFENRHALIQKMDEKMLQHTAEEWSLIFRENDIPHSVLRHIKDITTDEQARSNCYMYPFATRASGEFYLPAPPVQFGGTFPPAHEHAPLLGEQTKEVLLEMGYTEEQLRDLRKRKVIFG